MKMYLGIDYRFSPASYWSDPSPQSAVLRNVKGEARRRAIKWFCSSSNPAELDHRIFQEEIDEESRDALGKIDPSYMGGEYLPGYKDGEVEIARIALESTTADVISIRARPSGPGIAYRVEDEYDSSFDLPFARSRQPLSLARLVRLLDVGRLRDPGFPLGLSLGYNQMGVEYSGYAGKRHFTLISSEFYPDLQRHYEHAFNDWVEAGEASQGTRPREGGPR